MVLAHLSSSKLHHYNLSYQSKTPFVKIFKMNQAQRERQAKEETLRRNQIKEEEIKRLNKMIKDEQERQRNAKKCQKCNKCKCSR